MKHHNDNRTRFVFKLNAILRCIARRQFTDLVFQLILNLSNLVLTKYLCHRIAKILEEKAKMIPA